MKKIYLFACSFICFLNTYSQECGFETPENYLTYEDINTGRSTNSNEATETQNVCINVCFRILRDDNGTNAAINPSIIPLILAQMNSKFNPHGITFYQIGTYDYINNSSYNVYTVTPSQPSPVNIPNCLNIYFIKNFSTLGSSVGGISSFGTNRAVIKGNLTTTIQNTTHEIGHALNLLHTFTCSQPPASSCTEIPFNINSFECDIRGDKICDTPADYNPLAYNSSNPPAYPTIFYSPDQTNIMSYWTTKDHFTVGQGTRMKNAILYAYELQSIRAYQCAEIVGADKICPTKEILTYSFPANGATLAYNWSVSGNLQIIGSATSPTVNVQFYLPTGGSITYSTINLTINGNIIKTKSVRPCYIRRAIGLYDWVSVDSGNMGLIVPVDSEDVPFTSYKWEITEEENNTSSCAGDKAHFVGTTTNEPYKFSSPTNQAVVNWGSCSKSYLITCLGISETGAEILINRSYVDVGDPKNNPCFKDAITTIVAPNPIQNSVINVVLNKPSHSTPCNYKDFNDLQYFNSELDQINNSVSIFDYNGNEVYRKVFETNEFVIDDANLNSGNNYIVNLCTKEGGFTQQVIIVQ